MNPTKDYSQNVQQVNGCRIYENPNVPANGDISGQGCELYIKNIPRRFLENDLLGHFDRFGIIYQFRLLMDYDNLNRGYGYLKYYSIKSAAIAMDVMNYYFVEPGVKLDIQKSYEKCSLHAVNIPVLDEKLIKHEFMKIFPDTMNIKLIYPKTENDKLNLSCSAILTFVDHASALKAKQVGSTGSFNFWGRTVKMLWAKTSSNNNLFSNSNRDLQIWNIPDTVTVAHMAELLTQLVSDSEILSIFQQPDNWLIEFTNDKAAKTVLDQMQGFEFNKNKIFIKYAINDPSSLSKADFDAELRLQCIANYWDPPIFLYGKVFQDEYLQDCAVLIRDNRIDTVSVFFIEIWWKNLVEIHARICEVIMKYVAENGKLPGGNLVLKCSHDTVYVVGAILDLENPDIMPVKRVTWSDDARKIYACEMAKLAKIVANIQTDSFDDLYKVYNQILDAKSMEYTFINDHWNLGRMLAVFDPMQRKCKPLKYGLSNRQMILVSIDEVYHNNNNYCFYWPECEDLANKPGGFNPPETWEFTLINANYVQTLLVHYTKMEYVLFQGYCQIQKNAKSTNKNNNSDNASDNDKFHRNVDDFFFGTEVVGTKYSNFF